MVGLVHAIRALGASAMLGASRRDHGWGLEIDLIESQLPPCLRVMRLCP
jgi:hypothetical protein